MHQFYLLVVFFSNFVNDQTILLLMRHYYYSDGEQQFGPFSLDELKNKRINKSTLVWTDGLSDWTSAEKIEELKSILISAPPPLPNKSSNKQIETVTIEEPTPPKTSPKHDSNYQKEGEATVLGVIMILIPIVIKLRILKFGNNQNFEQVKILIILISVLARIGATFWAVNIAKKQNRNFSSWGWLTFFFPGISLIILGQLRKLKLNIVIDGNIPKSEQISILLAKAIELHTENRLKETIEVLNKIIELENQNYTALLLRAESLFQIEEYNKAKVDFTELKKMEQFPDKSNLYLGIIEANDYNYNEAIELWKIAEENGSKDAINYLGRYYRYRGQYVLNQNEIKIKLGDETMLNQLDFGDGNMQYKNGIDQAEKIPHIDKYKTQISLHKHGFRIKLKVVSHKVCKPESYSEILSPIKLKKISEITF